MFKFKALSRLHRRTPLLELEEYRPAKVIPNLPPELWVIIIRYASAGCRGEDDSPATYVEYLAEIKQKVACSLVSKRWNAYTANVLYEFIWLSKARQAKALALTLLCQVCASPFTSSSTDQCGKHIRYLHIETNILDRCDPADIRVILDYAPNLVSFEDHRSVRRNVEEEFRDPKLAPEALLRAISNSQWNRGKNDTEKSSNLKRLTWTCYGPDIVDNGISALASSRISDTLEFLDINFCAMSNFSSSFSSMSFATITTTTSTFSSSCCRTSTQFLPLSLPALKTLKVTLDNPTFSLLASWDMPNLTNLSVNMSSPLPSSTSSAAAAPFNEFFTIHGSKITLLELGCDPSFSSSFSPPSPQNPFRSADQPSLATLCPNLIRFICSAYSSTSDVEWNWENPDWVAPHPLLTSHPVLEFIGVKDLGREMKRVWDEGPGLNAASHNVNAAWMYSPDDSPFFMLLEQCTSLILPQNFPNLKYIRDLSEDSDLLRRGRKSLFGGLEETTVGLPAPSSAQGGGFFSWRRTRSKRNLRNARSFSSISINESSQTLLPVPGHARVVKFWQHMLERAGERGVYVEDWRGLNLTRRDLERWERGLI